MNKKQTAVEWLIDQIEKSSKKTDNINRDHLFFYRMLEKAKAMEKEQIIDANISGMEFIPVDPSKYKQDAEQYYKETYGE